MNSMEKINLKSGFSLVEVLFYISLLVLVAVGSITFLLSLQDLLARQKAERFVSNTASIAMERILFEIRQSNSVNLAGSTLNSTSSVLSLTRDTGTVQFNLATGTIMITDSSGVGSLTPPEVVVQNFYAYAYDNGRTELVRVVVQVKSTVASSTINERLEGAVVIRGSYE